MTDSYDQILADMIAKGKTMGEAKQRRTKQTAISIMRKKHIIDRDKIMNGSLTRHHMAAVIITNVCEMCESEHEIVSEIKVWSHSPLPGTDTAQITAEVCGSQMYEFHRDIPLKLSRHRRSIAICPDCLTRDYDAQ